jgi:glycosyltransferase involved in cell wall biosynthesis
MNIVYINYEDTVGRRFNGLDLCHYFRARGDQCSMYVRSRSVDEPFLFDVWPKGWRSKLRDKVTNLEQILSIQNLLYPPTLLYRKHIRKADIIHFHLISMQYLSLLELLPLSWQKPLVLSLHDLSLITGCCVHPSQGCDHWKSGCHSCTDLDGIFPLRKDRTPFLWKYKHYIWTHVKPVIVVASKWMMNRIQHSPMVAECEKHLIPFGLDLEVFFPGDKKKTREQLGIPKDNFVIFFRALASPYKGFDTIKKALQILDLRLPITLISLNGVGRLDDLKNRYHIMEVDCLYDSQAIANLFHAADIFLMPSLQETFGMMAMESMACGVPSVVTRNTALEEVTRAPEAALAIPPNDHGALAQAIETLVANREFRQKMGERARKLAEQLYDFKSFANSIRELYCAILAESKSLTHI